MRTTAAVVAAAPGVAARVRDGDQVLLEVRRPPVPDEAGHRFMPVCVFHQAVAGAVRLRRRGQQVAMRGVPAIREPSVDWGVAGTGWELTGGILRLQGDAGWWHLAAVPVGHAEAVAALGRTPRPVDLLHDPDLDVTIAHTITPAGDEAASGQAIDRLIDALVAIGVADLERLLAA
ncbi:MAG: hypothetical protein ACRD29_26520 [Acidimicrobiales bacterium]